MTGTKRPDSVAARLRQFYERNPHEELSIEDMMLKFECGKDSIRQALREIGFPMERTIYYRRKHAEDGTC